MTDAFDRPIVGEIEIHGLRCQGQHGAYPGEQDQTRIFLVDIRVRTDITLAASTDSLADALDIAALTAVVREVVAGPPRALLERVAVEVAGTLLVRFPTVDQAHVRVTKPDPPGLDAAGEAVALTLTRV